MMGWRIVRHSFVLLWNNLQDALKVSLGPVLIGSFIVLLVFGALGQSPLVLVALQPDAEMPPSAAAAVLVALVVYLVVLGWVAVAWHRFILLEEYPALFPRFADLPVAGYVWRTVQLALVMLLAATPLILIMGIISAGLGLDGSPVATSLFSFALGVFFSYVWLRLALVLPGVAVGNPMTMRDAWIVSAPLANEILSAAMIVAGLNILINIVAQTFVGVAALSMAVSFVVTWITVMVGTSLLTTLYGHLIEGRDLP
jgi:hypothetical protein